MEQQGTLWSTRKRVPTQPGSAGGSRGALFGTSRGKFPPGFPLFSLEMSENVRKCQAFGRFFRVPAVNRRHLARGSADRQSQESKSGDQSPHSLRILTFPPGRSQFTSSREHQHEHLDLQSRPEARRRRLAAPRAGKVFHSGWNNREHFGAPEKEFPPNRAARVVCAPAVLHLVSQRFHSKCPKMSENVSFSGVFPPATA